MTDRYDFTGTYQGGTNPGMRVAVSVDGVPEDLSDARSLRMRVREFGVNGKTLYVGRFKDGAIREVDAANGIFEVTPFVMDFPVTNGTPHYYDIVIIRANGVASILLYGDLPIAESRRMHRQPSLGVDDVASVIEVTEQPDVLIDVSEVDIPLVYLENVEEDTNPRLGGDIHTQNHEIVFSDSDGKQMARMANLITESGAALYYSPLGEYDPNDGALVVKPGKVETYGAIFEVDSLTFDNDSDVHATPSGAVYPVTPIVPGWSVSDTDDGYYDLGSGTSTGPWVHMTGLVVTIPQALSPPQRVNVSAIVHVANGSATRAGSISVGFSVNGAEPDTFSEYPISGGFDGYIPVALTSVNVTLAPNDLVYAWVRRESGSHNQFHPQLVGTGPGDDHELTVSTPAT